MSKKKSNFQKSALYFSAFSVIASILSVVFLYFKIQTLGWESPISASLLASSFFFGFVAVVLFIIGSSDIPSFKVGEQSD
ncbi:MAG TPA: hypothetical protein EYH20_05935 [Leucothrix sp.]|nr:hypothetical protein [Leucothrix sp.]